MSLPLTIACNPWGNRGVFLVDFLFDIFFEVLDDVFFFEFSGFITDNFLADGRGELVGFIDVLFLLYSTAMKPDSRFFNADDNFLVGDLTGGAEDAFFRNKSSSIISTIASLAVASSFPAWTVSVSDVSESELTDSLSDVSESELTASSNVCAGTIGERNKSCSISFAAASPTAALTTFVASALVVSSAANAAFSSTSLAEALDASVSSSSANAPLLRALAAFKSADATFTGQLSIPQDPYLPQGPYLPQA
eukprot:scaffold47365_cov68-Attheya_sp.AAC.7